MIGRIACEVVLVNGAYAAAGMLAARRYGIRARLTGGWSAGVLIAGSALECALAVWGCGAASAVFVPAFGAVVTGAAFDAACGYVFDAITLPALALIAASAILDGTLMQAAFGAAAAAGVLGALYAATRGRGLGLGDVKLAACLGSGTGALYGMEALGAAFVTGGAYAAFLLLTRRASRGSEMRFAPYLAAGMAIVMVARSAA